MYRIPSAWSSYFSFIRTTFNKNLKSPILFIHFITLKCNCRCKHCFLWKELNKNQNELTLEEIEKISKSMGNIFFLFLTGGEPFMRDDIDKIVEIYYKNNHAVNMNISTNGALTERIYKKTKIILQRCPNLSLTISLSIDDFEKYHDKNRGVKGTYKKAIATYKKLFPLKKEYNNFSVNILGVITKDNQKRLIRLIKYFKRFFGPDVFQVNLIRGQPREPRLSDVDMKIFEKIYKVQKPKPFSFSLNFTKLKRPLRYNMNKIRSQIITDTIKDKQFVIPCYSGRISGVMMSDGSVFPCELLKQKMGNIRDYNYNFPELWKSKNAKQIANFIRKSKCFCTHECFLTANIVFNPKLLLKVLLNKNYKK